MVKECYHGFMVNECLVKECLLQFAGHYEAHLMTAKASA